VGRPLTRFYHVLLFSFDCYFILFPTASSLTRKRVCSLECLHSLVRPLTTNNHTLPSHPRLCSLSVASYDSQGLRWKYSNPPPHRDGLIPSKGKVFIFLTAFKPGLGPTQPPILCVRMGGGATFARIKEAEPLSSAEVENCGAIPPLPSLVFMA
jgi:hypothetical protein